MKKLLLAILFIAYTLPANSQIEQMEVVETEIISNVSELSNFLGSLRKKEEVYFIIYRDWTYKRIISKESFEIGELEDLYEFKKILYNVLNKKQSSKFKIRGNIFSVKPIGKRYLSISIEEKGLYLRDMGNWSIKKIDKLIPRELFSKN
ncbi:hypothetical protein OAD34_04710 [Flavobacteriaceae bacterium]|nr:hypothetical protein [Flavobacteriaceae bacterium]